MAIPNPELLEYLMGLDGQIRQLEKQMPGNEKVKLLKSKFIELAGVEFDRSVLEEVHEYTVERIVRKQAKKFYEKFPSHMQSELIEAYELMEHHRRRDSFGPFCEQLFKQIECCVRLAFANGKLLSEVISNRKTPAFTWQQIYNNPVTGNLEHRIVSNPILRFYGFPIQNVVLAYSKFTPGSGYTFYLDQDYDNEFHAKFTVNKNYIDKADISVKFRTVLYYLYFDGVVEDFVFEESKNLFEEIKAVRNRIHGGNLSLVINKPQTKQSKSEQKAVEAYSNRVINYMKYTGFLASFMTKILASKNISRLGVTFL